MRAKKVSVAMCTYNGERYLAEQLDSIVNQSYQDIEIVICDDGSSDGTLAVLREYAHLDSRIRVYENEANLGFVKNFEQAMTLCSGDLIALADQDDIWFPTKIEVLVNLIGESSMVYSEVQLVDELAQPLDQAFPGVNRLGGRCALSLLIGNCVTGHACLLRRDLLNRALPIPDGVKAHDQWLAVVASLYGGLTASADTLSFYRQHSANVMFNNKAKRSVSRQEKKMKSDQMLIRLLRAVLQLDRLTVEERNLVESFEVLLSANRACFYNKPLEKFLLRNGDAFLGLYGAPDKARKQVRKLCRGDRMFRYLPFV